MSLYFVRLEFIPGKIRILASTDITYTWNGTSLGGLRVGHKIFMDWYFTLQKLVSFLQ
jgi:hypothetical protein